MCQEYKQSDPNKIIFHKELSSEICSENLRKTGRLENIKTDNLVIHKDLKKIAIKDCIIDNVEISDCKLDSFSITGGFIDKLLIDNVIINIQCKLESNIRYTSIKKFNIEYLFLNGELNKFYASDIQSDKNVTISLDCTNSDIDIKDVHIKSLSLNYNSTNNYIKIYGGEINELITFSLKYTKNNIRIQSSNIENIIFMESIIPRLEIYQCNLLKSYFCIYNSIIQKIHWSDVIWPKKLIQYCNNDKEFEYVPETLRQLKLQAARQQNKQQELEFLALEMKAIKETNSFEWHNNLKLNKNYFIRAVLWCFNWLLDLIEIITPSKSYFEDKVIFFLGRYTNNFGLSWFRPLAIYIISSYMILIGISDYELTTSWKFDLLNNPLFYDFLVPKFSIDSIKDIVNVNLASTNAIFLLTKLFQGFLIYQFIRAFRRFFTK